MLRPRTSAALTIALALGGATAVHSAPSTAAASKTIAIKDNVFKPKIVTIARNTLVTWRWAADAGTHDVHSIGTKRFKSSVLKTGGVYRIRFTKAGTYKYVCTIHKDEGMTGRITVQ